MPKPIICLADTLCQFAQVFDPCFSPYTSRYFVIVLLAMVETQGRRTLCALRQSIAGKPSLAALSRFFSTHRWSPQQLSQLWLQRYRGRLLPLVLVAHLQLRQAQPKRRGRPRKTVVTGLLIFDDSVHHKPHGKKMGGLGQHYSSTQGHVVSGHCLFLGLYKLLGQRVPLAPQLYRQRKVAEAEGVAFQSKVDLAVAAVEQFEPVAETATHVLVDSWYTNARLVRAVRKRGWHLSGGLKRNRRLQVVAADGSSRWQSLHEYAAGLSAAAWQQASWPGQGGGSTTKVRKLGRVQVLITRRGAESKATYRYWLSSHLEATAQAVIDLLAERWEIEVVFEGLKDLLGSDDYQLTSGEGVLRYWTVLLCLLVYLKEERVAAEARQPAEQQRHVSWGEVLTGVRVEQQGKLLVWISSQV